MSLFKSFILLFSSLALTACQEITPKNPYLQNVLVVSDFGHQCVRILKADGNEIWNYTMPGNCQDSWLLPNGNILTSGGRKVCEVTPEKREVWSYTSNFNGPVEIHSCQPLPDGGFLVSVGGPKQLVELDASGQVRRTITLPLNGNAHTQMRIVRKSTSDTYWICCTGDSAVREFDANGKMIREITEPEMVKQGIPSWRMVHGLECLKNGNLLVASGYGSSLAEIDHDSNVVWKVLPQDIPEIGLKYAAGCQRLDNGNTIVAAHNSSFSLFEITPDKKIVWKLAPKDVDPTNIRLYPHSP